MKVFLSWSGDRSHQMAAALRDWLPGVLQVIQPWLSSQDIPKSSSWAAEIARIMEDIDVGILCLTPENLTSPWLLIEAGFLWRQRHAPLLCPYILDLSPVNLTGPLSQFQHARANREGTYQLLQTLNHVGPEPHLSEQMLQRVFEANWPWLEERIHGLTALSPTPSERPLTIDQKLDEILKVLRHGSGAMPTPPVVVPSPASGHRPGFFIGSSTEGLAVAEAVQLGLDEVAECTVWNQSVFDPSRTVIESLVDIAREFECAVLVLSPDDMVTKRGATTTAPRDNLIFEAGLFTGTLGRARTFLVYCRDKPIALPSDLAGVTAATYALRSDGNLHAALGPVCTRIKRTLGLA